MKAANCCIIVPIYKTLPNEYEIISLKQCCFILGKYTIIFITHKELDCSIYTNICQNSNISFKYEFFKYKYFSGITRYNDLLLLKNFYIRFKDYEYMLIYHLDSYVFRDELEYWCGKKYDFIGAPFVRISKLKITPEFHDQLAVGNGGFSLRNIKSIIKSYDKKIHILRIISIIQSCYNSISIKSQKFFIFLLPQVILFMVLNICKILFHIPVNLSLNEDVYWSLLFNKKGTIAPVLQAIKFAFENYPEYLYKLNDSNLPFGCHAWYTYYNYLFFKEFIK